MDPSFSSVSLLLHADGTNGSTTFVDNSYSPKTITAVGNAQISTASSKWGGSSILLDGTGDYLTTPNSADFNLATGDFTIEAWVDQTTNTSGILCGIRDGTAGWMINLNTASSNLTVTWQQWASGGTYAAASKVATETAGFVHVAVVRLSGVVKCYIDGVGGTGVSLAAPTFTTKALGVGADMHDLGTNFNGYIDDLRITKGVARYAADFTPPTAAFPEGVVTLLLHADGANASTTFTDSSLTPKTVTAVGNAQISTAQSKFGGSSAYFDGTGDAVTCPNSTDFRLNGDFTVEAWVYLPSAQTDKFLVSHYDYGSNQRDWRFGLAVTTGNLIFEFVAANGSTTTSINAGESVPATTWTHIAVSKSGSTSRIFIDGVLKASNTTLADQGGSTASLSVGSLLNSGAPAFGATCYIDDLRIIKGRAEYTAAFTPPTAAFVESYTTLLLNCNGANASTTFNDSSPIPKVVTAAGDAQISTAQSRFGGSSAYFDGTGDYLSTPTDTGFQFGTGDFTIELWVKTATTTTDVLLDYYTAAQPGWQLAITGGVLQWYTTATIKTGAIAVNTDAWVHIAIVRSAGYLNFYIDGVADGAAVAHATNLNYATSVLGIGGQVATRNATYDYAGYIDDLRITKGLALYTTDFTPPTAELTSDPSTIPAEHATAALTAPSPFADIYGAGLAALTAPSPIFYAGVVGSAEAALTAPSPTFTAATGAWAADLAAPSPTFAFTARDSTGENDATLIAPSPTLEVTTGVNAKVLTAPGPTLAAAGTVTIMARAGLTAPMPTLSSGGLVSGMASMELEAPSPNLVGYGGAVLSVTSITGRYELVATGTTGGVASAQLECPMFELTASGTVENFGSAHLIAPSPQLGQTIQAWLVAPSATLVAAGSAVITATYEAYAINLKHTADSPDEVTRYTNFPFTHVVRYKNSYYGANSTGLYLLEGTTDEAAPIPWAVKTAMTDFKTPLKKTVASAYFAGRFGPASTVALHAGEDVPNTYSFSTPRDQLAQNHRQVFGKGVKERYFALGASGTDVVQLDAVELDVVKTTRRI